ncbi:phosphoribosylaminoimidazole-succinocarboxamide synthase [Salsuginibacillus halophilus]|uniref:Phosphoribosylaminoimidazole-succinocarboxamide synthase n=1 Tax=Salsuginibacillus halophilus TaxID=517424 RepID=A0A2P8HLD9_9BACI|nr:phosphoribosylaminoimidazolesuccinocarboxamide synthase [Salsuginibacillus halophilus]PSL47036.1 phosphoribosylaminoimidazole-succinocarboxamide synthase [Salsuginibacillus halophilus]
MRAPLYEGKAKRLFETEDPNVLRVEYKDEATAFNGEKHDVMEGKAKLNNELSALFFREIEESGIPVHFQEKISETEQLVTKTEIIPLEVVVRNRVTGSLEKRTGLEEGTIINPAIVEFYYKDDALGDPLLNEDHIRLLGAATTEELVEMKRLALLVNNVLTSHLEAAGLLLIDFKLEFGRLGNDGEVIVADEISPDTCRFWDAQTHEKLDKDVYRLGTGKLQDAYEQVRARIGG